MFQRKGLINWQWGWLGLSGLLLLAGLLWSPQSVVAQDGRLNPHECSACHEEEYRAWSNSTHANSLTDPDYLEAWTRAGEPDYCKTCHATGYDRGANAVDYEGIACLACHEDTGGTHPNSEMTTDKSSELCGTCHTGTHAPDYDQWLMSDHATMNIGCNDCHVAHSNKLRLEDPTELCVSCHDFGPEDIHGQEGMACHDCHMYRSEDQTTDPLSGRASGSGHTFGITAEVCSECHGMTHTLTADGKAVFEGTDPAYTEQLETEVATLETEAQRRFDVGLTGGGIGGLVLGVTIPWLLRFRRREK